MSSLTKKPAPYLRYILDTLDVIKQNTPQDHATFMRDRNAQDATLMRLQDVGEQLIHLREKFPDFYAQHSTEDWPKIIGLRNIISHGYREVDLNIIWDIVTTKLQPFTGHIHKLAADE